MAFYRVKSDKFFGRDMSHPIIPLKFEAKYGVNVFFYKPPEMSGVFLFVPFLLAKKVSGTKAVDQTLT